MTDSANPLSAAYRFQHLTAFPPDVMRQIEAIYQVSFPPNERKPFSMVSAAIRGGHYSVFAVSHDDGAVSEIVAFALMAQLRSSQAMYIEYLAVAPPLREQGVGLMLMNSIIAYLRNTPTSAIVWEVDLPQQAGDDNSRRIRFYERLGAHLIEQAVQYGMPDYYKGSGILPLRMMWKPLRHDRAQPTKSELIAFITDIYETEYPGYDSFRDDIIATLDKP